MLREQIEETSFRTTSQSDMAMMDLSDEEVSDDFRSTLFSQIDLRLHTTTKCGWWMRRFGLMLREQ